MHQRLISVSLISVGFYGVELVPGSKTLEFLISNF